MPKQCAVPGCTGYSLAASQGIPFHTFPRDDAVRKFILTERVEGDCVLYGLFDGHDGGRASNFAAQRMPAEILLGQLNGGSTDDRVKHVLREAFVAVEKGFFEFFDHLIVERTDLHMQIPMDMSSYDVCRNYPELVARLQAIDSEIAGGTTATIALIYNSKLYVANVGNSRSLLCHVDQQGQLRVSQLTSDHTLTNENELLRFESLGLDIDKIQHNRKLGNHEVYTRCIGDYSVKGGYKDIEILSCALSEPVISEPEICDGMLLDQSCSFLLLMSDGLYKSLEDANGTQHVNADIASMVATEFGIQSTLNSVAQAVVDKVTRIHHDAYMTGSNQIKHLCQKRDDITLLVRNFNHLMPNGLSSPAGGATIPQAIPPVRPYIAKSLFNASFTNTLRSIRHSYTNTTSSNDSTQSEEFSSMFHRNQSIHHSLKLDEDGRIEPYVDFGEYYKNVAKLTDAEKETLAATLKLVSGCNTIEEEEPESESKEADTKCQADESEEITGRSEKCQKDDNATESQGDSA